MIAPSRRAYRACLALPLAFFACQLVLGYEIDRRWVSVRDPEYSARIDALAKLRRDAPADKLIVALGSSRVCYALKAGELGGDGTTAFNFALPGSGPAMQQVVLERLIAAGHRPDEVWLEIMPTMFQAGDGDFDRLEDKMLDGARLSATELSLVLPGSDSRAMPLRRWLAGRLLPVHRHQAEMRDALGIDDPPGGRPRTEALEIDAHGWMSRMAESTPGERDALRGLAHRQYDRWYKDFRPDPATRRHFRTLIARLDELGISRRLMVMPESRGFSAMRPPEAALALDRLLAELGEEAHAPLIDLRGCVGDEGFYDGHHLLPEGAVACTAELRRRLRR